MEILYQSSSFSEKFIHFETRAKPAITIQETIGVIKKIKAFFTLVDVLNLPYNNKELLK